MHELSVAESIVELAENEARKAGVTDFSAITLEIGALAGIELDALEFVWKSAVSGTVLEKAQRHIQIIPGKAVCKDCEASFPVEFIHDPCPECGSFHKKIVQGQELRLKSLELH